VEEAYLLGEDGVISLVEVVAPAHQRGHAHECLVVAEDEVLEERLGTMWNLVSSHPDPCFHLRSTPTKGHGRATDHPRAYQRAHQYLCVLQMTRPTVPAMRFLLYFRLD
jgi:hypothetical protein